MDRDSLANPDWVDDRLAALGLDSNWQPNTSDAWLRLQALRHQRSSSRSRWALLAVAVTAALLSLMTFHSPRVFAHYCLDCSVAFWQSLSTAGPAQPPVNPETDRRLAPDFALQDSSGKTIRVSDFRGQVVLLNFWATWCGGCETEIPSLIHFADKYKNDGFSIVGVAMDDDGWKAVMPYLKAKKINYSVVIGNETLEKLYGVTAMPVSVLIDRNGRIADEHCGVIKKAQYEPLISAVLQEKP
ncbi:MAG TPA: TlpA disulfide reductase family protein [Terriglobales bacterium]